MHKHQFFTWTTHTAEATTLLEATRLQKLYTYMCNIVTELVAEFYLYSIVYIYLINSRLDVTHSVRHHFRTIQTLSAEYMNVFKKNAHKSQIISYRSIIAVCIYHLVMMSIDLSKTFL